MHEELEKYITQCGDLKDAGAEKYAQYIHGHVIPTLESQREEGLLRNGKLYQKT